jgi:hypothetical protein
MTAVQTNRADQASEGEHGHGGPGMLLVIPVIVAVLLALFAWPQANLEPRGLPVGVAGSEAATAPLDAQIADSPDAFDIHRFADAEEARQAIEDREVYGAFVPSPEGVEVLTASGASPAVSAALQEIASGGEPATTQASGEAPPITVTDVVPADPDDPRGAAFAAGVLPLLIAGIITGILCATTFPAGARQIGALIGASALAGLAAVAVTQGWLDVIEGGWLANASVLALMILAVAGLVAGCMAVLGLPGIALAAVIVVLMGNPWSGIATAPELLPTPVGDIGQLLPPGAGGNALRSTAFFDGAGLSGHLLVLLAWVAIGLGGVALGSRRAGSEPAP